MDKTTVATLREAKVHELKTWPHFFGPIMTGHKTFEVRKNDRDFQAGDTLLLNEYDPEAKTYTGRMTFRRVTFILSEYEGLHEGYVVMGLGAA